MRFVEPLLFARGAFGVPCDRGPLWSCAAGLFLGNVPLPLAADTGLVDPTAFRCWSRRDFGSDNAPGILPFAAFILPDRVKRRFQPFRPRLPLNERPPRCFLFEGSAAIYVRCSPDWSGRPIMDVHFGFRDMPCGKPKTLILVQSRLCCCLGFLPVSGLRTPESARHGILNPIDRQPLRFLTTRPAIRSWA